jgi:hypothetical protein
VEDMRGKRPLTVTEWWDVFNKADKGDGSVQVTYGTLKEFETSVRRERRTLCGGCGKTFISPDDEDKHGFGACVEARGWQGAAKE